jgi:hypothetical protein
MTINPVTFDMCKCGHSRWAHDACGCAYDYCDCKEFGQMTVDKDKVKMFRCIKCGELFSEIQKAHQHYIKNGIDMNTLEMPGYTDGHFFEQIYFTTDMKIDGVTIPPGWYSYK